MAVLVSGKYGDVLVGGSAADTLNAGLGPDVLTGGAGNDVFVYKATPWNAGHITDFKLGGDRIDLSALLKGSNYMGSDPVRDGYVKFVSNGSGGTTVMYDPDGAKGAFTFNTVVTLDGVGPAGMSASSVLLNNWKPGLFEAIGNWLDSGNYGLGAMVGNVLNGLTGALVKGKVLVSDAYGDKLTGGAGDDVLVPGLGPDVLKGGLGDDTFVFQNPPWTAGHIVDFRPGSDNLDVSNLLDQVGYTGTNPIGDGYIQLTADGRGGTNVLFDPDGAGAASPWTLTTLDGVLPGRLGAGDWIF